MNTPHKGFIVPLLLVLAAVLLLGGGAYVFQSKQTVPTSVPVAMISASELRLKGWYWHDSSDIPALKSSMMLTRQKTYPAGYCEGTEWACFGEQIVISVSTTTLSAEAYVATNVLQQGVYPSVQKWGTLNGQKTFAVTYTTEFDPTVSNDALYLFSGNKVYAFGLYPSSEKNRDVFQQVVTSYANNLFVHDGIEIASPQPNELVKLPITVQGSINGNGWGANEGEVGWVQAFDDNGKAVSNLEILKATTDWLKLPVSFEATVGDRQMMSSLQTETGYLKFTSNAQKNSETPKTVMVPIRFK